MARCNTSDLLASASCVPCLGHGERDIVKLQLWCDIASASTATFTPESLSGLSLWLDASTLGWAEDDAIVLWPDSSGNGKNFEEVVDPAPTMKFAPFTKCAFFDENFGQALSCVSTLTAQPLTIMQVTQLIVPAGADTIIGLANETTAFYRSSSAPTALAFHTNGVDSISVAGAIEYGVKRSWAVTISAGNPAKFYKQGVLLTPNSLNGNNGTGYNLTTPILGGFPTPAALTIVSNMYVAELVYYNRELNATEIGQLQTYFAAKWGL